MGYLIGQGKPGYILLDRPDRWDVMYKLAAHDCPASERIFMRVEALIDQLDREKRRVSSPVIEYNFVPGVQFKG